MKKKNYPPLGLEDTLPFGKFRGNSISYMIENEIDYMDWLLDNTEVELDNEAYTAYVKRSSNK